MVRVHAFCLVASLILYSPSDDASSSDGPSPLTVARQSLAAAGSSGYLLEQQVCRPPLPKSVDEGINCQSLATSESIWTDYFKRAVSTANDSLKDPDILIRQSALLVVGNALYRFSQAYTFAEKYLDTWISMMLEDSSARVRVGAAGT